MAIEPLGSVMSLQAQSAPAAEPVQKTAETTEGHAMDNVVSQVDASTLAVKKADENYAGSDEGQDSGEQAPSKELIREAMKELNKKATSVEAEFGIHEKTNRITIKMVDKKTKEVIKELPPERMLDMIAKVWEMAGLVVDEKR